jgi:hypothetical protein
VYCSNLSPKWNSAFPSTKHFNVESHWPIWRAKTGLTRGLFWFNPLSFREQFFKLGSKKRSNTTIATRERSIMPSANQIKHGSQRLYSNTGFTQTQTLKFLQAADCVINAEGVRVWTVANVSVRVVCHRRLCCVCVGWWGGGLVHMCVCVCVCVCVCACVWWKQLRGLDGGSGRLWKKVKLFIKHCQLTFSSPANWPWTLGFVCYPFAGSSHIMSCVILPTAQIFFVIISTDSSGVLVLPQHFLVLAHHFLVKSSFLVILACF